MLKYTPETVKEARLTAGFTHAKAGETVYKGARCWQQWEYGIRKIDQGAIELFLLKTGQLKLKNIT